MARFSPTTCRSVTASVSCIQVATRSISRNPPPLLTFVANAGSVGHVEMIIAESPTPQASRSGYRRDPEARRLSQKDPWCPCQSSVLRVWILREGASSSRGKYSDHEGVMGEAIRVSSPFLGKFEDDRGRWHSCHPAPRNNRRSPDCRGMTAGDYLHSDGSHIQVSIFKLAILLSFGYPIRILLPVGNNNGYGVHTVSHTLRLGRHTFRPTQPNIAQGTLHDLAPGYSIASVLVERSAGCDAEAPPRDARKSWIGAQCTHPRQAQAIHSPYCK